MIKNLKQATSDFQNTGSTMNSRATSRNRRALITGISTSSARIVQVAVTLISVPLAVHYLGSERFGLWMTINSLLAMISFADFGLGNGLLNTVAKAYGEGDREAAHQAVSSAFFVLLGVSIVFCVIFYSLYGSINWDDIFHVKSMLARREAEPSVAVFFGCFAISLPLGVVQRIQLACQEGFLNGLSSAGGSLIGLAGLLLAINANLGLPWLVLAVAGGPVVGLALNTVVLFLRRQWLRPSWSACSLETSGHILRMGILFFVLQVAMAIGYQSDNLVLAHILGPKSVTQYTIPQRLFQFIPTFIGFFMLALWPAYSEAAARRDALWIMKTYRWSTGLNLAIGVPLALALFYAAPTVVDYWVGNEVHPSKLLLIALVGFCLTNTVVGPISALLNGLHVLRFQAVTWSIMAAMNLAISILLTKQIGLSGVAFGSMIAQLLCIIVPSMLYIPRCFRRLQEDRTGAVL